MSVIFGRKKLMAISVLFENEDSNRTNLELKCAHGLSLQIDSDDSGTIPDAGPDDKFALNTRTMGIYFSACELHHC